MDMVTEDSYVGKHEQSTIPTALVLEKEIKKNHYRKYKHETDKITGKRTRRERLKSTLYLSLKKTQCSLNLLKGGPFRLFENPLCFKISKKLRGDPLETFKKYKNFFGKVFEQN